MTKYGQVVLEEYNLGINHYSADYKQDGLASKLYNVECKNGKILSASKHTNIFELLEPTRVKIATEQFLNEIGQCLWVASFQFFDNTKLIDYVVFCSSDFRIYYYQLNAENPRFKCLNNIEFTSEPTYEFFIKDNKNTMIFCSQTDDMWVWSGIDEPYQVLDAPHVSDMAVGLDRLFVVSESHPYTILFSDDLDPSNWSMIAGEAGQVEFHDNLGKVLKVFALDNYIYVIRDYGIVKLYGYSETDNTFNISRVYFSTNNIYKNTISIAGDKIVFMCGNEIYSFDGLSCKLMYLNLSGQIYNPQLAIGLCVNNIYYLCANLYENLDRNNALACIDLESKNITHLCFDEDYYRLSKINVNNYNVVVVLYDKNTTKNAKVPIYIVKNSNQNAENCNFLYKTHDLNINPKCADKILTKLTLLTKNSVDVCIETDVTSKRFCVLGSSSFQSIKLNIKCKLFALKFSGSQDVDISHIKLDYCFVE